MRGGVHHKAPLGVYKVRATLLDSSNNPVSGFQKIKDVAPGDSGTITFSNVPAGTYNVKLEGLDSSGSDILYTGQTNGISVASGATAEPPIIARYTRSDNVSPGISNKNPSNDATDVPANTQISVQVSDSDAGVDATSIILIVNGEDVTSRCSILGTSDNYTIIYTPSSNLSGTVTVTLGASDLANPANSMSTGTWGFTITSGGTTDTTSPTNPSISFGSITETTSLVVTVTISATDDTGITGYYLSESTTASITSSSWTSIISTKSYNANVSFTLSSGNGSKTVYVWFKDAAGNISSSANATITLNRTDTTAPSNPSVSINNGDSSTTTTAVTLTLSATDDVGVTGYYPSESTIIPILTSTQWVTVASMTSYSATEAFNLSSGSVGDNTKTVYVWFRDSAGNVSAVTSDSITMTISDSTAPSNPSVSINDGDTSTTSTSVILSLSATDNVGVTGYYASEASTTPSASASGWTSVTSATSYAGSVSFTLSSGDDTKTVYVWFKDSSGLVSKLASDSITVTGTTVTDIDGNVYNIVTIGTQVWMKENLKVTKYRNGDAIDTTTPATKDISSETSPKYQWAYDGNESNVATYGRLYTWYAVTDFRGVCPTGWHVPRKGEWTTLTDYLGGSNIAGGKMKEAGTTHWDGPNTGADNSSGFTALPGGCRCDYEEFRYIGGGSRLWSNTGSSTTHAWIRSVGYHYANAWEYEDKKYYGSSVRCVRD